MKKRNRTIILTSQFNIHGSRGKSVKPFITDYVSRHDATSPMMGYFLNSPTMEQGDGVAFTLNQSAISRQEVLAIAEEVEDKFLSGKRAIQQMVISFDPDYLKDQRIVDEDTVIIKAGDYKDQYDDIRLRHAIRKGVQSLIDHDGYRDGQMIACIQHDTLHLHAHVVVYEGHEDISRIRGKEEKGMVKPSSMSELTNEIDRALTLTKPSRAITEKALVKPKTTSKKIEVTPVETNSLDLLRDFLLIYQEQKDIEELLTELNNDIRENSDITNTN